MTGSTMRAAVVRSFDAPLAVEQVAIPEPGSGQVLVRVEACGLCHTDIHAAHGDWADKPKMPFVPGHEGVGIVERLGPDVAGVAVGDRVSIGWLGSACGRCEFCVTGREELCQSQENPGYTVDGAFAEYAVAHASHAVPVPAGVEPADAGPLGCAGVATYKAMKMTGAGPADVVAIFGVGGLGHLAVQYARIAGAEVVAVDVVDEKLALARELGADVTVNAAEDDPVAAIQALGGAHAAIVLASANKPFEQAYEALRPGGTIVFVALPADGAVTLPIYDTVARGIHVVGSAGGTRQDLAEVYRLHALGRTRVVREERPLEDVNAAIAAVEAGEVAARVVLTP